KLWFLQTRVGKRTSFAEWVMAYDMVEEGLISLDEGLLRLDADRLDQLFKPTLEMGTEQPATKGLNASPGAAVGRVVFTADAAEDARKERIWKAFESFMERADSARRLRVRANADTPEQSSNARARGAEGIGLCRTEHMFLGEERVAAVRKMIFASPDTDEEREAFDALLPLQREDFVGIFEAMDGLPVTVRLLDPPLHEFLPNHVDLAV